MEQEGPINVRALRAKFQAEAALAQAKNSRPTIAEKPRHLPPPGSYCSSIVSTINLVMENKEQAVPRVIFREELRTSGGKRPFSFPPQPLRTSPVQQDSGGISTRHFLRERHLPLVLPAPPVKEHKAEQTSPKEPQQPIQPPKDALPQTKGKKKGLLLPFKSTKSSKGSAGNGEESAYTYLTTRPASAAGELSSLQGQDGEWLRGDHTVTDGHLSSPEPLVTPPSETNGDSECRFMSTLERAKKKFSCKHLRIYAKPKSFLCFPDDASTEKTPSSPLNDVQSFEPNFSVPSPVSLPPLACVSARPFIKPNGTPRKSAFDKPLGWDRVEVPCLRHDGLLRPPKRPLPDLGTLGPQPGKPPRPPCIDLGCYHSTAAQVSPDFSRAPVEEHEPEHWSRNSPVLDAPDFPDFEHSLSEAADDQAIHIASLELEALEYIDFDLPPPINAETSCFEALQDYLPEREPTEAASFDLQGLNLDTHDSIDQDQAAFPDAPDLSELSGPVDAEHWSAQSAEASFVPPVPGHKAEGPEHGASVASSLPEEAEHGSHAALVNGIEAQSSAFQQSSYYDACDNVYEDVENINKFIISQNLRKHKGGPKNPYAENHQKEDVRLNIWPRNPCKERQSPEHGEHKEQKKREKQRLEKERKEQKEKEKKENEMKKKFKVSGLEEPLYHAKVMVASKVGKKNDLPVSSGDMVSIIRTTSCPKGRWLARDVNQKYGYISVMNVELNIKEMLELGKKTQAAGRGGKAEADTISIGSRSSNHAVSSFTDDEEWACEDETISPSIESHSFHQQTVPFPEMLCSHVNTQHTLSDASLEDLHTQTRHEALQKLAIFFQRDEDDYGDATDNGEVTPTNETACSMSSVEQPSLLCAVGEPPYLDQEIDVTHLELLPPPPLYADTI